MVTVDPVRSSSSPMHMVLSDAKGLLQLKEQEIACLRESALQQLESEVSARLHAWCAYCLVWHDNGCAKFWDQVSSSHAAGCQAHRAPSDSSTGK